MKIIISPYSNVLRNGKKNAKNYPFWEDLISLLKNDNEIIQIGRKNENRLLRVNDFLIDQPLKYLGEIITNSNLWISVDNFLPHFCNWKKITTPGIVIFSKSDPKIFGYPQNKNIFKDEKYFRNNQFATWEEEEHDENAFVSASEIFQIIKSP